MMPIIDRRIYRRVWWTLFQTEIFTALEYGRPSMIHLDELDQAPLDLDDFKEENGVVNEKLRFDYCSRNIELCYMILDILRLNRPGIARQRDLSPDLVSLDSRMTSWILANPATDDFGSLQLHMHYQTVLIHLHRKFMTNASAAQQHQSTELCNRGASVIIAVFETMLTNQTLAQCYFTSVIGLTATAIHISRRIRLAIEQGSTLLALNTQNQLERLLRPAKELSQYWPNAEAVLKLFQSLSERLRARIVEQLGSGTQSGSSNQAQAPGEETRPEQQPVQARYGSANADANSMMYGIDWPDILLYPVMQPQYFGGDEDWMNVSPELGTGI